MLILAVDTSGKHGSIALAECGQSQPCLPIEVVDLAGGTFSAQLVPQIAALLARHGFHQANIGGFAVASGPGSFTGLRVGLAAVKALAEILKQPIAAVSLLEAIARSSALPGTVLTVLDAGRGEVYVGNYETGPTLRMRSERLLSRQEFLAESKGHAVVTPDSSLAEAAQAAGIQVQRIDYPRSDLIARLGWDKIQRGETILSEDLEANYIRRSDAEIFSSAKTALN